ncbi:unnamed protein product [Pylaiella littoralis]
MELVDPSGTDEEVEFLIPETLSEDQMRAVPLASFAGVGLGLEHYMEIVSHQSASTQRYRMKEGMTKVARSTAVLISTNPGSVFPEVDPAASARVQTATLSKEDKLRAPLKKKLVCHRDTCPARI